MVRRDFILGRQRMRNEVAGSYWQTGGRQDGLGNVWSVHTGIVVKLTPGGETTMISIQTVAMAILAQNVGGGMRGWGLQEILIAIVVIAAAVGLVFIALRVFGIAIPGWVVQCFWICVAAFVIIMAIRFVFSL